VRLQPLGHLSGEESVEGTTSKRRNWLHPVEQKVRPFGASSILWVKRSNRNSRDKSVMSYFKTPLSETSDEYEAFQFV
jgi:hypothetical protein